jgi:predicted Na+-dependent transporter
VLTGEAKGNVALAIFLSVVTNVVGVFTVPFFLSGFLTTRRDDGNGGEVRVVARRHSCCRCTAKRVSR